MATIAGERKQSMPEQIITKEEIAAEDEFMKGIPRFNIAAFFMPFIWGPANGFWVCVLYYPALIFADNSVYAAYTQQTPLSIVIAALVILILLAVTIVFSILSQPYAAHRAVNRGVAKETYLKRQKVWAAASIVVFIAMMVLATYYNLQIRPGLDF